ncbi:hypothetical protein SAMN05216603_12910 [Pseudomonas benzenivorans]|nr:PASTA domain-containing protein [Pseudomonas benzenivorans]SDI25474.1 hypothetical protein SAMN05216603_12910 [Pseudomonas benzenivorans]
MVHRYVIDGPNGILNARAAAIFWGEEQHGRGAGRTRLPLQLRWMLHPSIGLPDQPFTVWRLRNPSVGKSKQDLANLPGWEPVEIVGLPVDDDWADTPYSLKEQGPLSEPLPPIEAAIRRLKLGAPPIGWPDHDRDGLALPSWEEPDVSAYFNRLMRGKLLDGLHAMLRAAQPTQHHIFEVVAQDDIPRWMPRLLLDGVVGRPFGESGRGRWHPLGLLAMSTGTDPLAALGFGLGTALEMPVEIGDLYMVSVRHRLRPDLPEMEFADVVRPAALTDPVPAPAGLFAARKSMTRPQSLDAPALETVAVRWDRPAALPPGALAPEQPEAVSYAIGRYGPESTGRRIILTRRPPEVGGWLTFTPGAVEESVPIEFLDHVARSATVQNPPRTVVAPLGFDVTYVVAAQDLFGRWSDWSEVAYSAPKDEPAAPTVVAVALTEAGALTVDFAWDWSDRSPEFAELVGAFTDPPGAEAARVRATFAGKDQADAAGADVVPLDQNRAPTDWGATQDRPGSGPEVRFYRWTAAVPVAFADGQRWREFGVHARGQAHVHQTYIAGLLVSQLDGTRTTRVWNSTPPPAPLIEAPRWASLPDAAGIGRFVISWPSVPFAEGYVVYEATETALLGAFGRPAIDIEAPFTARMETLRELDFAGAPDVVRRAFRRLTSDLVPQAAGVVRHEASLPRGSRVIHLFAVLAVGLNRIESEWPRDWRAFVPVAVPRLEVPRAPVLAVDPADEPGRIRVRVGDVIPGGAVELRRVRSAEPPADFDGMGPPLPPLGAPDADGEVAFLDGGISPGWRPIWYRAAVRAPDRPDDGVIGGRSEASAAARILFFPEDAPVVAELRVNEPTSTADESLVSWSTTAPLEETPLGAHRLILEVLDMVNGDLHRARHMMDDVRIAASPADLPKVPAPGEEHGLGALAEPPGVRLYAWIPRPSGQTVRLIVKIVDPLGRIGRVAADIPPLGPDVAMVEIPPWSTKTDVLEGDDMGMVVFSAESLGLVVEFVYGQRVPGYDDGQVISIAPPASTMVPAGSTVVVTVNLEG